MMKKIYINLATHRYQSTAVPAMLAAALFLLAALYSAYNVYTYRAVARQTAAYEKTLARLKADGGARGPGADRVDVKALANKVEFINSIIIRKGFSWSQFLFSLEQSVPANVSIVEISPRFDEEGTVLLKGMARGMTDILGFVDNLGSSSGFSEAKLLRHTEKKLAEGTQERLFFSLSVRYVGEGAS